MADGDRDVWITGIGIASCLGEGPEAHWQALTSLPPKPDLTSFAPFIVHPMVPLEFDKQIPKRGDQRQMEPWQRIGTYTAGLALDSAGIKGNAEVLSRTDMIVAAGGGERDLAVDSAVLSGLPNAPDPAAFLNERLMSDLRPTLFLAQLSNLLAGNISIVHGVTGSSRTFMGEESAGIDSVRVAFSRIASGQSEIALVGGAHSGERKELLKLYEFGRFNLKERFAPVWERQDNPGFALGSLAAFLVLESRTHATARSATPTARLRAVASDRSNRQRPGAVVESLGRLWDKIAPSVDEADAVVISGTSGAEPATGEERSFLAEHAGLAVRSTGSHLGHGMEPQFPMNVAIAALTVQHGELFAPTGGTAIEKPKAGPVRQAIVTGVGHWRGEGMALVEAVP
jgi:3-oxoacyl-[acyl-carrier-protein] synthase II